MKTSIVAVIMVDTENNKIWYIRTDDISTSRVVNDVSPFERNLHNKPSWENSPYTLGQ